MESCIEESLIEVEIIEDVDRIMEKIQLGTSIPISENFTFKNSKSSIFRDYLYAAFKQYNIKAILLKINEKIIGITIIFNVDFENLYFGFFGVETHTPNRIQFLINNLKKYGKKNNFKFIKGPINIPPIIFGFGFLAKSEDTKSYIGRPINSLNYYKKFMDNRFYPKHRLDTYFFRLIKIDLNCLDYDFREYKFLNLRENELSLYREKILLLHLSNMPNFTQITPNPQKNAQLIYNYLIDNIESCNIWIIKHKSSNDIIGCGYSVTDPITKDIISFEQFIIKKSYQGKGLAIFMSFKIMNHLLKYDKFKILNGMMSIEYNNKKMINFCKKYLNALKRRRYFVFEYKI
ncbi:MAG: hypothetical protein KGD63_00570 [Candidatus Lokiarchaeota archaeon]|nr:hypothetical protein [Candidatus Lokiarchaeota archaeon]